MDAAFRGAAVGGAASEPALPLSLSYPVAMDITNSTLVSVMLPAHQWQVVSTSCQPHARAVGRRCDFVSK